MSFNAVTWLKTCSPLAFQVRFGHRFMRGKPPGIAKSLKQRLEPIITDEELARRHDIGFPFLKQPRSEQFAERLSILKQKRKNAELEKLARSNQLEINLDEVKSEWFKTSGPLHLKKLADHYGIYNDLFGKYAYFVPRVQLNINFQSADNHPWPVYNGNKLFPADLKEPPKVSFDPKLSLTYKDKPEENTLWTLLLTNPDGHLTENEREYVHWMIANIPNADISKGETLVPYLQPLPFKGTGYHRYIFVLYKQDKKLDFSNYKVTDTKDLAKRTFYTFDFYRDHQDSMTPAGLAFFQSKWDASIRDVFHKQFNMAQPIFEYDFPEAYLRKEKYFPKRYSFNLYMDIYADPKDVNKRFVEQRLAKTHPFDGPEPPLRFPTAHRMDDSVPSWKKTEIRKERMRWGRINDAE